MILWLASYPRSGNTYFRLLLKQLYDIETRSVYYPADKENLARKLGLFGETARTLDEVRKNPAYQIVKTHELASDDAPAIYLVRDGRDTLVSHAHYFMEYELKLTAEAQRAQFAGILRRFIETDDYFGGWSSNIQSWVSRSAPTVILRYEDLIDQPLESVRRSLQAVNYPIPERQTAQMTSFAELHKLEPQFFRKGKAGAWREEMPGEIQQRFWQRHGETMAEMGYKTPTLLESTRLTMNALHYRLRQRLLRSSAGNFVRARPFC